MCLSCQLLTVINLEGEREEEGGEREEGEVGGVSYCKPTNWECGYVASAHLAWWKSWLSEEGRKGKW